MSYNEIEALVNETFRINRDDLTSDSELESLFRFDDPQVNITPENSPGVLFRVDKKPSTFLVRCFKSSDLKVDYLKIIENPEDYPSLKLNSDLDVCSQFSYFECETSQIADKLISNIANKRFPLNEENLFNVSDHSDHWWVNSSNNELTVSFKLRSGEDSSFKIGALGDIRDVSEKLKRLFGYFKLLFPVKEYSLSDSQFKISCSEDSNLVFDSFKDIFISGRVDKSFWNYLSDLALRSQNEAFYDDLIDANNLLKELSAARNFWDLIESKV